MDRIVIVGAGLTAATAAATLRDEGYDGELTLVGSEKLLPYERPPLSKSVLQGKKPFDVMHDADWYAERSIRVVTGATVTALEPTARTVTLTDDTTLTYDACLLATGATPRELDLPGIDRAHKLRTRADEEKLAAAFEPGARLVTIGGGWIALEVAAAAREAGVDVTVLERGSAPLAAILGAELSDHLKQLHESHGVDIRTNTEATGISDDGVLVGDEVVPADVVLLASGAVPSTDLAAAAGLGVDNGIIADPQLRSTDPNIWVAGDVANATNTVLGPLRVEHWDNAIRQGKLAARSILGQEVSYDWQPYFFTDQFEFSMEYVGRSSPQDSVVIRGDLDKNAFIAYWIAPDGHTMTAGMNVGIWDVNDQLREMIGTTVDPGQLTVLG